MPTATIHTIERLPANCFLSVSGRTVIVTDPAGLQRIAEEHEWLRDRVAHLELHNAMLRSLIECSARPVHCQDIPAA